MAPAVATPDRYLADFRALEQGLDGLAPDWLRQLRQGAFARFQELGFPTARKGNEPWKYTNVAPIAAATFAYPAESHGPAGIDMRSLAPWAKGMLTAVFVDGRYSEPLSSKARGPASVSSLADAIAHQPDLVQRYLARHATLQSDAFTALNTAFLRDGAFVHLPQGASLQAPVNLVFVSTTGGAPAVSYPRALVVAGPLSDVTLIETYVSLGGSRHFTDAVTEIVLEEGARIDHYRLLLENMETFHVGATRVYQGRDSSLTTTSFAAGAALGRHDLGVLLDAPGATSQVNGLYITTGSQHMDNNINIDHAQPHGRSRLYYKGILDGKSRAVFGGTVLVRPGADKTDAYQEDKNLLLSDEAEVDSKPSLEIYADDVKCGHGATAGAATEDAMFYLQSRGIDAETAMLLLVRGFAAGILDQVRVEPLRAYLEERTMRALPRFSRAAAA